MLHISVLVVYPWPANSSGPISSLFLSFIYSYKQWYHKLSWVSQKVVPTVLIRNHPTSGCYWYWRSILWYHWCHSHRRCFLARLIASWRSFPYFDITMNNAHSMEVGYCINDGVHELVGLRIKKEEETYFYFCKKCMMGNMTEQITSRNIFHHHINLLERS